MSSAQADRYMQLCPLYISFFWLIVEVNFWGISQPLQHSIYGYSTLIPKELVPKEVVTALSYFYSFSDHSYYSKPFHYCSALDCFSIQQIFTTTRSSLVTFLLKGQPLDSTNQCQTVSQASASSWAIRIRPKCDCAPNYLRIFLRGYRG